MPSPARSFAALLWMLACALPWASLAAQEIRATVGFERPERQFLQVRLDLRGFQGPVELVLPVWTPGSYKVRDYSQYVEGFTAVDGRAAPVPFRKLAKNRWRLESSDGVTVSYRYFAAETSVRHCFLDSTQAFLMPGCLLPYAEGGLDRPCTVRLELPPGWHADTSLEEVQPAVYRARDFDELMDSPIQVGTHERLDFEIDGTAFRMTLTGDHNMNAAAMVEDMRPVIAEAGAMFGGFPFDRYLFLVRFGGGGGLEHANSTSLMSSPYRFDSKSGWESFLGLVAHEFFHAWNVKRIRDAALGPFDYTQEVYTRLLWVHEGWTSYYAPLLLRRAGVTTDADLLRSYERLLGSYRRSPGRLVQGLAESSFDSWIKYYQTTATSHNSTVDYYSHGRVAALCLDLILRHFSGNAHGLDDVLRRLWEEYGRLGTGFEEEQLRQWLVEMGGPEAEEFWARHVAAPGDIDLGRYLAYAGLEWSEGEAPDAAAAEPSVAATPDHPTRGTDGENGDAEADPEAGPKAPKERKPWEHAELPELGFATTSSGNSLVVRSIEREGAAWLDGLAVGDELLAVGDRRITPDAWNVVVREALEQGVLELTIARAGRLQIVPLRLDGRRRDGKLTRARECDDLAAAIYESLFDAPFRKPGAEGEGGGSEGPSEDGAPPRGRRGERR